MAKDEAWMRIILPVMDNRLAFQLASFFLTLSKMEPTSKFLSLLMYIDGNDQQFVKIL